MARKKQEDLELITAQAPTEDITTVQETTDFLAPDTAEPISEDLNDLLTAMDDDPADTFQADTDIDTTTGTDDFAVEEPMEAASEPVDDHLPEEPATEKAAEPTPKPKAKRAPKKADATDAATKDTPPPAKRPAKKRADTILTIEAHSAVETHENVEDIIWHEIHNAYRTRKMLTGNLGGIEKTENGKTMAIVEYKGFRVIIPIKEMMINLGTASGAEYEEMMRRQNKVLGNMLGAEIDFLIKGIDSKTRSVVASRKEAMLKKRQLFYLNTDAAGMYRIYEGRVVQARVIAVAEKVVRVEVFGAECSILARDLAWDWIGDAHERFSVGDEVLVRVLSVRREGLEDIAIKVDAKSVSENQSHENLKRCRVQSKYAGKVTDVHKGVVYLRLTNGINAVAHSCYDRRMPGKKDDVSFAVTRIDEERGVAVGIITRIIKQNL